VHHPVWIARVRHHRRGRTRQSNALVELPQQHHATVARQIPAAEIGLDQASTQASKLDPIAGTLWHGETFSRCPQTLGASRPWKVSPPMLVKYPG
jgi:hypothetical protein